MTGYCGYLPKPTTLAGNAASAAGNSSRRCFVVVSRREPRSTLCLNAVAFETPLSSHCADRTAFGGVNPSCRYGMSVQRASSSSSSSLPARSSAIAVYCISSRRDDATERPSDSDSDSDSASDCEPVSDLTSASDAPQLASSLTNAAPLVTGSPEILEPESWLLIEGEDVPTVVSSLPLMERYAPRRLFASLKKKLETGAVSPEQLKNSLMFWQKKKKKELQDDATFGTSAFGEQGVSSIHQWTATELTLQHARLARIARDILYLVLACSLLGIVRVLEAVAIAFSSRPPHLSRLMDAANSLDFFTMAWLAYSVRRPVIGILRVDPTNLDEVVQLKSKIWDEMHKFYERQWKLVATLAVGRLLALIAQKLPSTNILTRNLKWCWDFLLALPIF